MVEEFEGLTPERKKAIDKRRDELIEQFGKVLGWRIDNPEAREDDIETNYDFATMESETWIANSDLMVTLRSGAIYFIASTMTVCGDWLSFGCGTPWETIKPEQIHAGYVVLSDGVYFPDGECRSMLFAQIRASEIESVVTLCKS